MDVDDPMTTNDDFFHFRLRRGNARRLRRKQHVNGFELRSRPTRPRVVPKLVRPSR